MKINDKIIIIPPYISTSWKNVNTLFVEMNNAKKVLVILLHSKTRIEIPNLDEAIIEQAFSAHKDFLEKDVVPVRSSERRAPNNIGFGFPITAEASGIEMLGDAMQHNPNQADAPDLPKEVINKIISISKIVGIDDTDLMPKAQQKCNCFYCQIAKAMHPHETEEEEIVSESDLAFRSWNIKQSGDKLYIVTNPLEEKEQYNVFLGNPIGCTCGEKNCAHIKAVLKS